MPPIERRQIPRTTMERLAYINIEPNNGGIVLNVSEQGLCFHSIAPVVRNGKLRFSLLEQNHRIEADGELVWMDDAQKVGGVHFVGLPPEARKQIENWITQPAGPFGELDATHASDLTSPALPGFGARWSESAAAPAVAVSHATASSTTEKRSFLSGFSGGLAVGLLIAALITGGFLLHNYRHQLGESLIQLGQKLSGKTPSPAQAQAPTQNPTPNPTPALTSPIRQPTVPAQAAATSPDLAPARPADKFPAKVSSAAAPARKVEPETKPSPIKVARGQNVSSPKVGAPSLAPPPVTLASGSSVPISKLIADKGSNLPRFTPAVSSDRRTEDAGGIPGPPPKMYFEVGKFKQESWARKATDELAHLGFPTSVAQKGRFWGNAYYVLVGPYDDRDTADRAHKTLASSGFKPRPFERGSRSFTLSSPVVLNRSRLSGEFEIRWESYVPDAKVKFLQEDLLVTSADARWIERGTKNQRNAFVYQRNPDGTHTLLEIRFAGMSKVLVFAGGSS